MKSTYPVYGLLAEFETPDQLIAAAQKAHQKGYKKMDAYAPFPVEGLSEAMGSHKSWLPLIVLIGAMTGAGIGFALQYYGAAVGYPLNVGGRPLNSWPAFIPVTFETTILIASFSAVLGMFALNGLPMPYHPVFNVPRFALATQDRFFLCIEGKDRLFDLQKTREFLASLNAREIFEVEP